jgi:hypothetical protein
VWAIARSLTPEAYGDLTGSFCSVVQCKDGVM